LEDFFGVTRTQKKAGFVMMHKAITQAALSRPAGRRGLFVFIRLARTKVLSNSSTPIAASQAL